MLRLGATAVLLCAAGWRSVDGARLRKGRRAPADLASLGPSDADAVRSLAAKYDCDAKSAELATELESVALQNRAAVAASAKACSLAVSQFEVELERKLADADALQATASAKGAAVYGAAAANANAMYRKAVDRSTEALRVATAALEAARTNESESLLLRDKQAEKLGEAVAVYKGQKADLDAALKAQKSGLNETRNSVIGLAQRDFDTNLASAQKTQNASNELCKSAFNARMDLLNRDEDTIQKSIKPLLEQLNACGETSESSGSKVHGDTVSTSLLEMNQAACLQTRRRLGLAQSSIVHDSPSAKVTGNIADWERRLAEEKRNASGVRMACEKNAQNSYDETSESLRKVFASAKSSANENYDGEVSKIEDQHAQEVNARKKAVVTSQALAAEARAAYAVAEAKLQHAEKAEKAAAALKSVSIAEADSIKKQALRAAAKYGNATTESVIRDANIMRSKARADKKNKTELKTSECSSNKSALEDEYVLIQQIKHKISSLVTVSDDVVGKAAEEKAADAKAKLACQASCQNGGSCKKAEPVTGKPAYTCECADGFEGDNCEFDIDECMKDPCQNGATCIDKVNSYECKCAAGYSGDNCQVNIDECAPNPCGAHGACTDHVNSYSCHCEAGYEGDQCEREIDECKDHTCANGAKCKDKVAGYECICTAGYEGTHCEVNTDDCASSPCKNGGACSDLVNGHKCTCPAGYSGSNCETNINECAPNPCKNGGACKDGINSYSCTCKDGFKGTDCEIQIPTFKGGCYNILTSGVHSGDSAAQPANWGLSAWRLHGGQRNSASSWAAVHSGSHWPMPWKIEKSKRTPGTWTIKTTHKHSGASGRQPADEGLSSWMGHGAVRNSHSARVAVHSGNYWLMDWKIEPSKRTPGTWVIKTSGVHSGASAHQPADWGLSAWQKHGGARNGASSWVYTHDGDHWLMDWKLVPTGGC